MSQQLGDNSSKNCCNHKKLIIQCYQQKFVNSLKLLKELKVAKTKLMIMLTLHHQNLYHLPIQLLLKKILIAFPTDTPVSTLQIVHKAVNKYIRTELLFKDVNDDFTDNLADCTQRKLSQNSTGQEPLRQFVKKSTKNDDSPCIHRASDSTVDLTLQSTFCNAVRENVDTHVSIRNEENDTEMSGGHFILNMMHAIKKSRSLESVEKHPSSSQKHWRRLNPTFGDKSITSATASTSVAKSLKFHSAQNNRYPGTSDEIINEDKSSFVSADCLNTRISVDIDEWETVSTAMIGLDVFSQDFQLLSDEASNLTSKQQAITRSIKTRALVVETVLPYAKCLDVRAGDIIMCVDNVRLQTEHDFLIQLQAAVYRNW